MFRTAPSRLARPLTRALSTTTPHLGPDKYKSLIPTLGQIPKGSDEAFADNLVTFREKVEAQQTAAREAAQKAAIDSGEASVDSSEIKTGGVLTKLLHGSSEAQQDTFQIKDSFSKVLARGKYVHEIVFHRVKPECLEEYVELISKEYPRRAGDQGANLKLVGSWATEVGEGDVFVHIWEYNGYSGYLDTLQYLEAQQGVQKYNRELRKTLVSRSNSLAQEFSFWPTTQPRELGGLFELRSYTLHPGSLLEWETHWRKGLAARQSQGMEGVGAWFTQIGGLNEVHYLWQFGSLEARRKLREKSWQAKDWSGTVHKTIPLIAKMQSKILLPFPWSPVK